eukprot:scaffold7695_cov64-Phaeocystis_antarctica.AAC.2
MCVIGPRTEQGTAGGGRCQDDAWRTAGEHVRQTSVHNGCGEPIRKLGAPRALRARQPRHSRGDIARALDREAVADGRLLKQLHETHPVELMHYKAGR